MHIDHSDSPIFVVRHRVIESERERYEVWLKKIGSEAMKFDGHLGAHITRPAQGEKNGYYTIVIRFDIEEHLIQWAESDVRAKFLREIEDTLLDGDNIEIHNGIDFWFTPEGSSAPLAKPWKQFLVTLSAIFPLTILVPWSLEPMINFLPENMKFFGGKLLVAASIVLLMVYLIMPRYTKLISGWLYK